MRRKDVVIKQQSAHVNTVNIRIECILVQRGRKQKKEENNGKTLKYDNSVEFRSKTTDGASIACNQQLSLHARQSTYGAHARKRSHTFHFRLVCVQFTNQEIAYLKQQKQQQSMVTRERNTKTKAKLFRYVAKSRPTMTTPSQNSISGARPVISGNYVIDHDYYYVYYTVRCVHTVCCATAANSIDFISK